MCSLDVLPGSSTEPRFPWRFEARPLAKRRAKFARKGARLIGRRGGPQAPFAPTTGGAAGTLVAILRTKLFEVWGGRGERVRRLLPRASTSWTFGACAVKRLI